MPRILLCVLATVPASAVAQGSADATERPTFKVLVEPARPAFRLATEPATLKAGPESHAYAKLTLALGDDATPQKGRVLAVAANGEVRRLDAEATASTA